MTRQSQLLSMLICSFNSLQPSFPYLTWDCADDLEGRLKKTLYHGGKSECMGAVSSAALAGK